MNTGRICVAANLFGYGDGEAYRLDTRATQSAAGHVPRDMCIRVVRRCAPKVSPLHSSLDFKVEDMRQREGAFTTGELRSGENRRSSPVEAFDRQCRGGQLCVIVRYINIDKMIRS